MKPSAEMAERLGGVGKVKSTKPKVLKSSTESKKSSLPLQGGGGYLQCPVDFVPINENKARVTAFFVLGLVITYLLTQVWFILALLAIDFLLRATNAGKYSPLGFLADAVIKQLSIKNKPVDRGSKRFAASVGFVFIISILVLLVLKQDLPAQVLTYIMAVFAVLEAFAGFCAGCYVYSAWLFLLKKRA